MNSKTTDIHQVEFSSSGVSAANELLVDLCLNNTLRVSVLVSSQWASVVFPLMMLRQHTDSPCVSLSLCGDETAAHIAVYQLKYWISSSVSVTRKLKHEVLFYKKCQVSSGAFMMS